uniref:Clathrin adaptor alpha/beta/gamma-adaptin appendage Ig-like subdomain domain-containing protein n=1 Tax=Plectus sambesii TaxID=2011161 RepID=A0A914V2H4_9BILA
MVKVGGYILGEFGNLIAGDPRSSPQVQFELLHNKYHLCAIATRSLLLSTYVKFCNLFPEIKPMIQEVFRTDHNLRNPDAELQQRAIEYLQLSRVASPDVLATVLEEMPPFAEKESSLLAKLKKDKPRVEELEQQAVEKKSRPTAVMNQTSSSSGGGGGGVGALVDLGSPTGAPPSSGTNGLMDVFAGLSGSTNGHAVNGGGVGAGSFINDAELKKFVLKQNGVMFENDLVQIGIKLEARGNLARVGVFYGNKTGQALTGFAPSVACPGELASQLIVQAKPVDANLGAGTQVQQLINVECLQDFSTQPLLNLRFTHGAKAHDFVLRLPLFINKFFEPTEMTSEQFFARWKQLSQPTQECQKIFPATQPMDNEQIKTKLSGLGSKLLLNVDPNPENYVCAGIIHTKALQIGTLIRLEPNRQAKMYRLTIRSSRDSVAKHLCDIISQQF